MSDPLVDAREALTEWEHRESCDEPSAFRLAVALKALLSEFHLRELHHFESETLLEQLGIDPDDKEQASATVRALLVVPPTTEWEYSVQVTDGSIAPRPVASVEAARQSASYWINGAVVRRRKSGQWELIPDE